ncbi:hypothetical protein, variant [Spizellomyces punctatus DAOM BR117]|uniref:PXA domain-containing protein n=1 Tax=Spizellomyces punctatus (strain DAOM BR117) TaxID=645134 RepID=A0A0L0HAF4_SPIPD|nr:hypothetical protein, variant [Spizellomyces punctatus DAOM BR117]KNC97986.1 hypothetical protein, variant [Spizellomyces punctatus DAOM BR117]|eukprot:XP_016606026.1 hypothetical protein, variant [Spizellomyces punctatus DAOM BR117]
MTEAVSQEALTLDESLKHTAAPVLNEAQNQKARKEGNEESRTGHPDGVGHKVPFLTSEIAQLGGRPDDLVQTTETTNGKPEPPAPAIENEPKPEPIEHMDPVVAIQGTDEGDSIPLLSTTARRVWRQRKLDWRTTVVTRWPWIRPYWERVEFGLSLLPPGWPEKLPILAIAFLFSPRLFAVLCAISVATLLGYMWGVTSGKGSGGLPNTLSWDHRMDQDRGLEVPVDMSAFSVSPSVHNALEQFCGHIVRDFINNWYSNINHSGSTDFPEAVHASVRHVFIKLGTSTNEIRPTALALPVFQTIILHMREYRVFESSSLQLDEYLSRNPNSAFNLHRTKDQIFEHLRRLSMHLAVELLPRGDRCSPMVFAFVQEILATSVLLPIVEMCSDSDWINRQLLTFLRKSQASAVAMASKQTGSTGSPQPGLWAPSRKDSSGEQVYVKVVEARRLPIADMYGLYCSLLCGTKVQRSRKINAESNPMWMEEFRFDWDNDDANGGVDGIVVDLLESRLIKDEIIGSVYVPMSQLPPNKFLKGWLPIDTADTRFAGVTNAEILLEAIRIAPAAGHGAGTNSARGSSAAQGNENPNSGLSNEISDLTAEDILVRNEGLVEFMQYMDDIKSSDYIQLYVMIDSFNRFAKLEMSSQSSSGLANAIEGLRTDALSIFDTFFSPSASQRVDLESPELVERVRQAVLASPGADVFRPLQQRIVEVTEKRFMEGFKHSQLYQRYLVENGLTLRESQQKTGSASGSGSSGSDSESVASANNSIPPALPPRLPDVSLPAPELPPRSVAEIPAVPPRPTVVTEGTSGKMSPSTDATPTLPPRPPAQTDDVKSNVSSGQDAIPKSSWKGASDIDNELFTDVLPLNDDTSTLEEPVPGTSGMQSAVEAQESVAATAASEIEDETDAMTASIQSAAHVLENLGKNGNHDIEEVKAAINTLREQVTLIDSIMRRSADAEKLSDLASTKLQLQTQVEELADLIAQEEQQAKQGHLAVDLRNVRINILDMTAPEKDKDEKNIFAFASTPTHPKSIVFIVQIERTNGSGGWMISKSYADIIALNEALRTVFPKVRKSNFPQRTRVTGTKAREELSHELERWLNIIASDATLYESAQVQDFMKPENIQTQEYSAKPVVATKVLGTLKSAGSILRKVAVATPMRAATFVASEVNAAVAGVAHGMKKNEPTNSKTIRRSSSFWSNKPAGSEEDQPETLLVPARASSLDDAVSDHDEGSDKGLGTKPMVRNKSVGSLASVTSHISAGGSASVDASNATVPVGSNASGDYSMSATSYRPETPPRSSSARSASPAKSLAGSIKSVEGPSGSGSPARHSREDPPLSDAELEIMLECVFGIIEEVFHLSDPNQWLRQKGLHMVKTILRRTYGTSISTLIQSRLIEATTETKVASYVDMLDGSLWPEGIWYSTKAQQDGIPPTPRSEEDMAETKMEAKHLFINSGLGGVETVARVVGKYNTVAGMTRLFNMLQHQDLNRHLVCMIMDRLVKSIF